MRGFSTKIKALTLLLVVSLSSQTTRAADKLPRILLTLPNVVIQGSTGDEKPITMALSADLQILAGKLILTNLSWHLEQISPETLKLTDEVTLSFKKLFLEAVAFKISNQLLIDHLKVTAWTSRKTVLNLNQTKMEVWGVPFQMGELRNQQALTGIRLITNADGIIDKVIGSFTPLQRSFGADEMLQVMSQPNGLEAVLAGIASDIGLAKAAPDAPIDLGSLNPKMETLNPWEMLAWICVTGTIAKDGRVSFTDVRRAIPRGTSMELWVAQKKSEAQRFLQAPELVRLKKRRSASEVAQSIDPDLRSCLLLGCGCLTVSAGGLTLLAITARAVFRWFFY